jgi:hypothetical protein
MDKQSIKSGASTTSSRHKAKICGICGMKEGKNFKRHCENKHDGKQVVLTEG